MRYVRIEGGVVINATEFDGAKPEGWDEPNVWLLSDEAQIGWAYEGGDFVAPPSPEPEPQPAPPPTTIPKDVIWRRATDNEAEQMEAALQSQPVRLRRIYEGATFISTEDELYGVLESALVQLFGAERAAELLEPAA